MTTLTRKQLDGMHCANPDCTDHENHDGLILHAVCHPQSPPWTMYQGGLLYVFCSVCQEPIVRVAVKDE